MGALFLVSRLKNSHQKKIWEIEKEKLYLQERFKQSEIEAVRLKHSVAAFENQLEALKQQHQLLLIERSQIEVRLEEEKKNHQQKVELFIESQHKFGELFKGLSAEALRQNNHSFLQLAQTSLEKFQQKAEGDLGKKEQAIKELVTPVKESLDKFDAKIRDLEQARVGAYATLTQQVHGLMEFQKQLQRETSLLSRALRSPNTRGRWGEIQLRRVIELAGMLDHCDFYEQQTSYTDEEKRVRPDLLIRLPSQKNIVIDAKAPLSAYFEAVETDNMETKSNKFKEHARTIRSHISLLSKKATGTNLQQPPNLSCFFCQENLFLAQL